MPSTFEIHYADQRPVSYSLDLFEAKKILQCASGAAVLYQVKNCRSSVRLAWVNGWILGTEEYEDYLELEDGGKVREQVTGTPGPFFQIP